MSFRLSPGTLDELAGVYAPAEKHRAGSGGGKGKGSKASGSAIARVLSKTATASTDARPSPQAKRAFRSGSVKAATHGAIAAMERTARGSPEVMVRVTGRQRGAGHVLANFIYISRLGRGDEGDLALHTSEGDILRDRNEMRDLAEEWHQFENESSARRAGATSLSMILSMPAGTDPEQVQDAALAFAKEEFANRMWVASLHVDRDHPHVHLTLARRDDNGRRFNPDRADLFRYRKRFAQKLRDRGIDANATPARARGVDPAHEPIAVRKARDRGEVPRIDRSRIKRAERLREEGHADPAEAIVVARRAVLQATYERTIAELSASPSMVNQMVAKSVGRFVAAMPAPEPNSVRAARGHDDEREVGSAGKVWTVTQRDELAEAMAQLRAATAEGQAILAANRERELEREREHRSWSDDPSRTSPERSDGQPADHNSEQIAEILRQVQERDRAHRDRQREQEQELSRDRGRSR